MPRHPDPSKPVPGLQGHIAEDVERGRPGSILPATAAATPLLHYRAAPAFQAYRLLRVGFVLLLLVEGADKFFNSLARWPTLIAPLISQELQTRLGLGVQVLLRIAGGLELGLAVLLVMWPRLGVYVLALWLSVCTANLVWLGSYLLAVQRFVLFVATLALARLVEEFRRAIDTPQDWER